MQRSAAETTKPPAYPFYFHIFKEHRNKISQIHHKQGATNQKRPQKLSQVLPPATVAASTASTDALFTKGRRSPQEEKDR